MWSESWPPLSMVDLRNSLKAMEALVQQQNPSDEISAELSRFLVVRTCGYLEQVVELCCKNYLKSKSDPRSAAFGESWLGRGSNPKPSKLVELVKRFDTEWGEELHGLFAQNDELLRRELEFLVDKRNRISHGLNQGIGMTKALSLVPHAITVSDWFIIKFDPR